MGDSTSLSVASIHTAQDAANYLSEAVSVIRQRGTTS